MRGGTHTRRLLRLDQDAARHRKAQCIGDFGIGRLQDHRGESNRRRAARGRRRTEDLPGPRWNFGQDGGEHLPKAGRHPIVCGPVAAGPVASCSMKKGCPTSDDEVLPPLAWRGRPKLAEQVARLRRFERSQLEPLHATVALDLGEELEGRLELLEIVGTDGEHIQLVRPAGIRKQELDQAARGGVGPLDVVDDNHDRAISPQPVQHAEICLEQAGLRVTVPLEDVVAGRRRGIGTWPGVDLGQEPRELDAARPEERGKRCRFSAMDERAQRFDERSVRRPSAAGRRARPGQDRTSPLTDACDELPDQARFADTRLAADDHDRGAIARGPLEGSLKTRQLGAPSNEPSRSGLCSHDPANDTHPGTAIEG